MTGRETARNVWSFVPRINLEISASVGFIVRKFITMHDHMNIKIVVCLNASQQTGIRSILSFFVAHVHAYVRAFL